MNKKSAFICLLCVFITLVSYGQKGFGRGYVITNNSDTLFGSIQLKNNYLNHKSCEFKRDGETESRTFLPGEIRAYRIQNSKYYVTKEIEIDSTKRTIFLEYMLAGIVNLYYYKDVIDQYFFIEKDNKLTPLTNKEATIVQKVRETKGVFEHTYNVNSNQYKHVLQYLFQDSPTALKEIPSTNFDYKPLLRLTRDYHNSVCKDQKCIEYAKSTNKSIFIEPYVGVIDGWLGLKTSKQHANDIKPFAGILLRFKPFKGLNNWNLLTGVSYSTNEFNGDFENSLAWAVPYRIHEKYTAIRIPIVIEYTFPTNKLQPFVSVSYHNILLTNSEYSVYSVHLNQVSLVDTPFRKYNFGLGTGLGVRYIVSPSFYVYLKDEIEYRIPGANLGNVLDNTRVFSDILSFGVGFKLK